MIDARITLLIIFSLTVIGMTSIIIDMLRVDPYEKRISRAIVKKNREPVGSEESDFEVNSDVFDN